MNKETFYFTHDKTNKLWKAQDSETGEAVDFEQGLVSLRHVPGVLFAGTIHALHGVSMEQAEQASPKFSRHVFGASMRSSPMGAWRLMPDGKVEKA